MQCNVLVLCDVCNNVFCPVHGGPRARAVPAAAVMQCCKKMHACCMLSVYSCLKKPKILALVQLRTERETDGIKHTVAHTIVLAAALYLILFCQSLSFFDIMTCHSK